MGRQSSRIIWGKTQKNPEDHDYNLVRITDYDPENIYTSGNIVIAPETSYGASEEDYKAWQCVASEAAGEFSSWDESVWKELKGIKVIGKVVYVPDTEAQQIINPKRNVYKPGAKVIKLDKNGSHYIYKCIQENNIQVEGFVPSKWEVQMQRVGVAWIPRDHKDVYYNGKYHWAMWMMPEEFDDKYNEEISLYDPEMQYFRGEYCICFDNIYGSRPLKLYKYVSNYPNRGIFPPPHSALEPDESATWMEMKNVSEHVDHQELGQYPKDTKIIYEEYNQETSPVSDFVIGREYDKSRSHTCLHLIKPQGGSVSDKDHEILCATGDYTRTADPGGGYRYSPVTEYAKQIEGNYPIYGFYEIDESAPSQVIDTYFDIDHWHLKTLTKEREGYSVRIAIKEWSLETSRTDGYEVGDFVLFSVPNSDTLGVYKCMISHHADSPTYLPTEVPESYNSGTLDAKQPTDTKYWKLREETYIDRQIHLYKSVRLTKKYELARKDWVIQTQNKHWDLESGDEVWGFIWKKYGWSKGGNPFYFPMLISSVNLSNGSYYFRRSRLSSLYPFMGDNVLELTDTIFESGYHSEQHDFNLGNYVNAMHATANGIFGYSDNDLLRGAILLWKGDKKWKTYNITDYLPGDIDLNTYYGVQFAFYGLNTMLVGVSIESTPARLYDIYKIIFMDAAVVCNKLKTVNGIPVKSFDGYIATKETTFESKTLQWEVSGEIYTYTQSMTYNYHYITDINGNTINALQTVKAPNWWPLPNFTEWQTKSYFAANCRIITKNIQIEGLIWRPVDFYDIKNDLRFTSYSYDSEHSQTKTGKADDLLSSLGPKEDIEFIEGFSGTNCYALRHLRYCYVDTNEIVTIYYKTTVIQIINGAIVTEKILSLGGNDVENTYKLPPTEPGLIDIDNYTIEIDADILITDANPVSNIIQLGKFCFKADGLYYFRDDRVTEYYSEDTGKLVAYRPALSAGLWEVNMSAAQANLVVDLTPNHIDTRRWDYFKQILMWDTILKIPYYGNQTCRVGNLGELQYLYVGPGVSLLYNYFPEDYPDLAPMQNHLRALIDKKLWIHSLDEGSPCSVKCSADTGYPIQGDRDLVVQQYIEIENPDNYWIKEPATLIVVLPNYYSIHRYDSVRGYDPIVNGAFFWLVEGLDFAYRISPTYGGPERDAQGFSGW